MLRRTWCLLRGKSWLCAHNDNINNCHSHNHYTFVSFTRRVITPTLPTSHSDSLIYPRVSNKAIFPFLSHKTTGQPKEKRDEEKYARLCHTPAHYAEWSCFSKFFLATVLFSKMTSQKLFERFRNWNCPFRGEGLAVAASVCFSSKKENESGEKERFGRGFL